MAEEDACDLYMKFQVTPGYAVAGETQSNIELSKSDLTKDFKAGKMFEVTSFSLSTGIGTENRDAKDSRKMIEAQLEPIRESIRAQNKKIRDDHIAAKNPGAPKLLKEPQSPKQLDYSQFLERGDYSAKYPIDMDPIEFTRTLDRASSVLLQNCINRVNYASATLIKRRPTGGPAAGEAFLRIDFDTVLMTNIEWSDDIPIKETCKFVCRAVTVNYKPQLPDGSLGERVQGFWKMAEGLKPVQL